jgi:hypothetical protein
VYADLRSFRHRLTYSLLAGAVFRAFKAAEARGERQAVEAVVEDEMVKDVRAKTTDGLAHRLIDWID